MTKRKYKWTADAWNVSYPIGTKVRVTLVKKGRGRKRPEETFDTATRSVAWPLGHGETVVLVHSKTGGYSVEPGWMKVLE